MTVEIVRELRSVDLFARMDEELIEVIAAASTYAAFDVGDRLTRQGADPDGAWIIVDGEVEILRNSVPVATLGPGDLVGDLSLISGRPHAADAVATTRGGRVIIGVGEFRTAVRHHPEVAFELIRVLVDRIYHMQAAADRRATLRGDQEPPA